MVEKFILTFGKEQKIRNSWQQEIVEEAFHRSQFNTRSFCNQECISQLLDESRKEPDQKFKCDLMGLPMEDCKPEGVFGSTGDDGTCEPVVKNCDSSFPKVDGSCRNKDGNGEAMSVYKRLVPADYCQSSDSNLSGLPRCREGVKLFDLIIRR